MLHQFWERDRVICPCGRRRGGSLSSVDNDQAESRPRRAGVLRDVPRKPIEVDPCDLRPLVVPHALNAITDLWVGRVVKHHDPSREGRRPEQILHVAPNSIRCVVPVDKRELDRDAFLRKLLQDARE